MVPTTEVLMCHGRWMRWSEWERAQREEHDVRLVNDPQPREPEEPLEKEPVLEEDREEVLTANS